MISFEDARRLVLNQTRVLLPERKNISEISGFVLAEDVKAKVDLPLFSNSAMDGFALQSDDVRMTPVMLKIKGCIRVGDSPRVKVERGEAVKIMTGACLPQGANAVVMVEDTEEAGGEVLVRKSVRKGENIRRKGEEIRKGQLALKRGTRLSPGSLGFLAAMGREKAIVFGKPGVSLLITGSELVRPGRKLKQGEIWESNSIILDAALAGVNIKPVFLGTVRDNIQDLEIQVQKGLEASDILLITGGISVGDCDFVQQTLMGLNVRKIFWKVAMKPGKPLFFGIKGKKLIFGLPGNPVSVLVTFLEFVRPAILKMMGERDILLQEREAVLEEKLQKKAGKVYFLRGVLQERNGVTSVKSAGLQHSHVLESFARSDCLVYLGERRRVFEPGERVRIQILPWI